MSHYHLTIENLQKILKRCYDSEEGYKLASEKVDEPYFKGLFLSISGTRAEFAKEIFEEITRLGGDPTYTTSIKGDLHRTWIDIRAAFTKNNEELIIEECIRGEESMLEDYEEAFKDIHLPTDIGSMLSKQMTSIRADLNRLKRFEKVLA